MVGSFLRWKRHGNKQARGLGRYVPVATVRGTSVTWRVDFRRVARHQLRAPTRSVCTRERSPSGSKRMVAATEPRPAADRQRSEFGDKDAATALAPGATMAAAIGAICEGLAFCP